MARPSDRSLSGRRFLLNCDGNDVDHVAPPGRAQAWIRDWYRRAFAAGADVPIVDVALPDVVETKDTPSGEVIGARFPEERRREIPWYRTIRELVAEGTDVLHLACEEGHAAGALVLGGTRMSDAHHGRSWQPASDNPLFAQFVIDHPEWCNTWEDGSRDATLNYAVPEVQERRLAILREMAENYDVDGLELCWMRWCRHFPEGRQRQHAAVLTGFVGRVRQMLDQMAARRGAARLLLGHRVAGTVEECLGMGCDVAAWARLGSCDFLAPMDFLFVDLGVRTEEFVAAVEGSCPVYPGFGSLKYSFGRMYDDNDLYEGKDRHRAVLMRSLDRFRAAARNYHAWGGAGASSFNMYCWDPAQQEFHARAIAALAREEEAGAGPREYIYLPVWKDHNHGVAPTGRLHAQSLTFGAATVGRRQGFAFRMADGRDGSPLAGALRLRLYHAAPEDRFAFDLNGVPFDPARLRIAGLPEREEMPEPAGPEYLPPPPLELQHPAPRDSVPFSWPPHLKVEVDLAACPPLCGDNELGVTLLLRASLGPDPVFEALEVYVR